MRFIVVLLALTGCTVAGPVPQTETPQSVATSRSAQATIDNYLRIGARIERVAERVCRQKNPSAPGTYCDFQLKIDTSETRQPNAFQTIGQDGRPIIAFNIPMLQSVRNDHEIAFILGHEAAHQIENHIVRSTTNASIGALLLGGLIAASGADAASIVEAQNIGGSLGARAYSQTHELEADVLGTYITEIAGFNASIGAQSFARFGAGGGFLSTHPPSQQRLATVARTIDRIAQDRAAGRPIQVP